MIRLDPPTIEAALSGNRAALDSLIRAAERPVFNLALRMLANHADAQDATQEILIKIVTHLGEVRDLHAAGGWALHIATRHLIGRRKRGRVESLRLTFTGFATDLDSGLAEASTVGLSELEERRAIEEIKIGCTLAMMTCLTRAARMAYLLGDVFSLADADAAEALGIADATYRRRLGRAREAIEDFVRASCGLVSDTAPCRCPRRIGVALATGRIRKDRSSFGLVDSPGASLQQLRVQIQTLERGRLAAALMRSNPQFVGDVGRAVMARLDGPAGSTS